MIHQYNNNFCFLFNIRRLIFHGILIAFMGITISSCSSLKNIDIEVSVLPEYPINENIQSIALLNRSLNTNFTNNRSDSLEKILMKNKMVLDSVFQDSIASDTIIKVAARAMFESGRFDVVVPREPNILRADNSFSLQPLNNRFIQEICGDFKVDAVLVLENFAERLTTKYYLYGSDGYGATTDIACKSEWRLYRPDDTSPVMRFQYGDSIFWSAENYTLENLYAHMPRTKVALIGGGISSGLKMAKYISPGWINQRRYYFVTGKKEIDAAIPLIYKNTWAEAEAVWSKYATERSAVIRSKVEFNLALAAEMLGDIDLALEWALKSFKTRYTKASEVYLKTLDNKKKEQLKESKKRY